MAILNGEPNGSLQTTVTVNLLIASSLFATILRQSYELDTSSRSTVQIKKINHNEVQRNQLVRDRIQFGFREAGARETAGN